jgi:TPR repeat protein
MRVIFALCIALMMLTSARATDPYEDAMAALRSGDYAGASQLFQPLAESGNADAQLHLAEIYYDGLGGPRNLGAAAKWYSRAANQGKHTAQCLLSGLYEVGEGVPKDVVTAMMWLDVAAAQGYEEVLEQRAILAKYMTSEQIVEAKKLADEWHPVPERPVDVSQ